MKVFTQQPIVFEDDWLIAIDKPAGVLSHPNPGAVLPCAFAGRYETVTRCFQGPAGPLWLIHRLDQDASGVLLAAKKQTTADRCRKMFEVRAIRKVYLALVAGTPSPSSVGWRDHLEKQTRRGSVRSIVRARRPINAELRYRVRSGGRVLSNGAPLTLLEILLLSGRTHQIRVQAASRDHPVAGDRIYGDFALNRLLRRELGLRRLFLHALRLEFEHPATQCPLTLEAPLPSDLAACLESLSGGDQLKSFQ